MAAVSDDQIAKRMGLREKYTEAVASILDTLRKWSKGFYPANELAELRVSLGSFEPALASKECLFQPLPESERKKFAICESDLSEEGQYYYSHFDKVIEELDKENLPEASTFRYASQQVYD